MGTEISITSKEIATLSSKQLITICRNISSEISSIEKAINAPPIQLSQWRSANSECIKAVLVKFIEGTLLFYGRNRDDMNDYQVSSLVNAILDKYYYFRIEDVCLCFKRARESSSYGGFYGRIDGSVIMAWFATYDRERDEVIHSLDNVKTEYNTEDSISRDEYKELLLARIAGGDLYANADYMKMCEINNIFFDKRIEIGNYKYNRLHKFDKK
ncbi:hypothetical protein [Bacteroides sp. OM08-17BH]|uniref:hypothetical protein n=1 Tax=Bacteroides sp. OM08-17BH TaxID=2292285 RepID=UPI0011C10847|nr:hypothetical protein [Bacteroides sp. OM08-17BH]